MKVVSFFSGLGGLDKGFVDTGYDIVWANDFDKYAVETYRANFGDHVVLGDINNVNLNDLPEFDMLIGGFPCQPFSTLGKLKGFDDERGTLFFTIKEIIKKHAIDFGGTLSDKEVMMLCQISRNSYYKYKRELKAENNT